MNPEIKLPEKWRAKVEEWKPVILAVARILVVLAGLGGGSAVVVSSTQQEAKVEGTREKVLATEDRVEWLRQGFLQRVDVEEKERIEDVAKLRERLAALEAQLADLRRER